MSVAEGTGTVYVVATPIGNLEDVTDRARRVLSEVDLIACEDTRRTGRLCARLGVRTPRISLHAHNEGRRIPSLLRRLESGGSIALASDAGTPLLSDPGERLVAAAIERGVAVVPIPGPSAILAALVVSGLPIVPFTFLGFPPRRGKSRDAWMREAARAVGTVVLFEAPHRIVQTLRDLHASLGPRRAAVSRELTKRFEEVVRGRLGQLEVPAPRGELTVVVAPPDEPAAERTEEGGTDALVDELLRSGVTASRAARELAIALGIPRSEAYRRLLARKPGSS